MWGIITSRKWRWHPLSRKWRWYPPVGLVLFALFLLALTSLFLKGGSYLFTWSLLFNLGALGFVLARKQREILSNLRKPGKITVWRDTFRRAADLVDGS